MGNEVIKSFLVSLGFGVDEGSLSTFNKSLVTASLKVTALFTATQAMAAGIVYGISSVSEGFEQMGYEYRLIAPAINKALLLRQELMRAYSAAGINITKVVQQSVLLNFSLQKTKFAFEAIYRGVASRFFPLITQQSDLLRKRLYDNMPRIQAVLEKFVKFVFQAFDAITTLGERVWSVLGRVYDFLADLHKRTEGWSTIVLALVAAWKLLSLGFLASPFGLILIGLTALIALWDDFMTFKEGGQSFINWGSDTTKMVMGLIPIVAGLAAVIVGLFKFAEIAKSLKALVDTFKIWGDVMKVVNVIMALNPLTLWIAAIVTTIALLTLLIAKWEYFKKGQFKEAFSSFGSDIMNLVGGGGNTDMGPPLAPVGANGPSGAGASNSNFNQSNTYNIHGADAHSMASQVGSAQTRSNAQITRSAGSNAQ